jgi:hypothetical protein
MPPVLPHPIPSVSIPCTYIPRYPLIRKYNPAPSTTRYSSHLFHFPPVPANPSPFFATSFRGNTSTCRLSSRLSSGVITFSGCFCCCCCCCCGCAAAGAFPASLPGEAGGSAELGSDDDPWVSRGLGAGKFPFLSTASTRRWKRLKRASARMRVESRSMVHESSLTVGD